MHFRVITVSEIKMGLLSHYASHGYHINLCPIYKPLDIAFLMAFKLQMCSYIIQTITFVVMYF